jgi:hypothetical protein
MALLSQNKSSQLNILSKYAEINKSGFLTSRTKRDTTILGAFAEARALIASTPLDCFRNMQWRNSVVA